MDPVLTAAHIGMVTNAMLTFWMAVTFVMAIAMFLYARRN